MIRVATSRFFSELSTLNSLWKGSWIDSYIQLFSAILSITLDKKFAKLQQAHPPTLLNSLLPGINWAISIYLGMNRFLKKKSCQLTILLKKGSLNRFFNSQLLTGSTLSSTTALGFRYTRVATSRFFSELSTLNSLWKRNRFFYTTLFSNSFYHFRGKFAKLQQAHPPTLLNSLLPGINWAISSYLGMNRFLKK